MPLRTWVSALLLGGVWVIEVIRVFAPSPALITAGMACLGTYVLLALSRASRHLLVMFVVMGGSAAAIAAWIGDPRVLLKGFSQALGFGAFLPSVMLLRATTESSPRIGKLRDDVGGLGPAAANNWTLYGSHMLGSVLNVGAMAILAPVVSRDADPAQRLELARAAARGVGMGVMWSPFYLALAFVNQIVPASPLWQAMLMGIGLAALGFAFSYVFFTRRLGAAAYRASLARLRPLMAPASLLIGGVVLATLLFGWNGLQAVAIVVPVICVAYIAVLGPTEGGAITRRTITGVARISDELLIVAGATLLGAAIAAIPAVQQMGASVTPDMVSGPVLIIGLVFVMITLGQLGVHPMIGASVLVPIIAAGDFALAPVVLVATTVFAWALNAGTSIFSLPAAVAASTFQVPAAQMLSRRTLAYLLVFAVAGITYLSVLNAVIRALSA